MIENIIFEGQTLAIVLRSSYHQEGIKFFTCNESSQQLAYMNRPAGYVIAPHVHKPFRREIQFTKEVLFIKSGKVRVDFYDDNQNYLESRLLLQGDVVLLASGGHGFEMLETSEIVEVKQGPYAEGNDKIRFEQVPANIIRVKGMQ
jgi:hypothetical protein